MDSVFYDFQKRAKSYEKLSRWITDQTINETAIALIGECQDLIDVGCGTGFLPYCLNAIYPIPNITLLDLSPNMLEIAKRRLPQANVINNSLEEYAEITQDQYSTVIMRQVLHYIEDPIAAMECVKKLLKTHGRVYIGQFTVRDDLSDEWHAKLIRLISVNKRRSFTIDKLCKLCEGFKVLKIQSTDYEENLKDYFARKTSNNSYELIYNTMIDELNNEIIQNMKVHLENDNLFFTVQFTHLLLQVE